MILTAPYSEVSSPMTNLFIRVTTQYIENMFKKSLNVYDTWFGFYIHFKKVTFLLPYDHRQRKLVKDEALNKKDGSCQHEEISVVFMII